MVSSIRTRSIAILLLWWMTTSSVTRLVTVTAQVGGGGSLATRHTSREANERTLDEHQRRVFSTLTMRAHSADVEAETQRKLGMKMKKISKKKNKEFKKKMKKKGMKMMKNMKKTTSSSSSSGKGGKGMMMMMMMNKKKVSKRGSKKNVFSHGKGGKGKGKGKGVMSTSPPTQSPLPQRTVTEVPTDPRNVETARPTEIRTPAPTLMPSSSPSHPPTDLPTTLPSVSPTVSLQPTEVPCGGPCEDGDLCTINTCDLVSDTCQSTSVACGENEACDAFTGICQNIQNVVPCVAVIDEWDNRNYDAIWNQFRAEYPQRAFCLLVPNSFVQRLPTGWEEDTVNNPDGIDRTKVVMVNRDGGNPALASDWFNACGLDILSPSSITFIGLFIDTSGSMTLSTVRASYEKFLEDTANANIEYDQVFNGSEQWINPFLVELKPPVQPTTASPSALPSSSPSASPTTSFAPSLVPTTSPSSTPSLSSLPSSTPSSLPSIRPSTSPSNPPSFPPMLPSAFPTEVPSQSPTTASPSVIPSSSPTATPTTASPSEPPSESPTTEKPSNSPTNEPSSSPTTSKPTKAPIPAPQEQLVLNLSGSSISAGASVKISPVFLNENGMPINPPSTISYSVASAGIGAGIAGTMPVISTLTTGVSMATSEDTRGLYTVTATVDDFPEFSATEDLLVFAPADESAMDALYVQLSESVNGFAQSTSLLEEAVAEDNISAIQILLDDFREQRDGIDLEELRLTAICAPDEGFFPSTAEITASGYPETPDDASFQKLIQNIISNLENFSNLVEGNGDIDSLIQLNAEAAVLSEQYRQLSPTLHGWVLARDDLNYLYASAFPNSLHSLIDALEAKIIDENIGVTRRLGAGRQELASGQRRTFGLASLAGASAASAARSKIIKDVYVPVAHDLARSAVIMAIGSLLNSFTDNVGIGGVKTGASLSFQAFKVSNSWLEVGPANVRYPSRVDVTLIGTTAVETVEKLVTELDPRDVKNVKDLYDYYKKVKGAIEDTASAAETANQISFQADDFCLLAGNAGSPCVRLFYPEGFDVVNTCSFICFPQPVLFLVKNLDDGGMATALYNFAFT